MRSLVTNADGLGSDGIVLLAEAASERGLDVQVIAPCEDSSGASASLAAMSESARVVAEQITIGPPPGQSALGVYGAPAFIVRAAAYGAFGPPPEVVLSGVNRGPNTGRAVLHSGTVGAALTAATYGIRALAISAGDARDPGDWGAAAEFAGRAIGWLMRAPPAAVLNVNLPSCPRDEIRGVVPTRLASIGTVQANVTERDTGSVPVTFADAGPSLELGTDTAALAEGFVTVTALRPLCEDNSYDVSALLS